IYKLWEKSGFFNPDNIISSKKYCNILPPPNANGELHLGHASGYAVMDIFGRFERMNGKKVLLLPGKDHAGIQTQVVFEKKLKAERGIDRHALGQAKFYRECYEFCKKSADYMRGQEKKLGISADWSREKFTLDPDVTKVALETFVKMHSDGMIYRGRRIINWCPRCGTALSDIEVHHKEEDGKLYYIQYPIKNSKEFIVVATTRPETMLGDSAIAVHPKDKNYFDFIGKTVLLPLQDREIPIIADRRIDLEFGTGAVKITPAHDPLDWQIGKTHKLPEFQVINEKAKITKLGGKYAGQDVLEARKNILADLSALGLLGKEESLKINKSICERCKSTIEPLISKQWFVKVDAEKYSLKKEALKAVRGGKINFYPESLKRTMIHWLTNLEDWCISRQIWWGHQLPIWYCKKCGDEKYIVSIERPKNCPTCKGSELRQNPDTFDTWFSSSQWAYSTLGYPEQLDYKKYYPTDMMVMGRDILSFWASRMIMLSLYRTKKIPFKNLYFTGLIRDKDGFKMSKSRNNGIDPLEMVKKFGSDALRLSLIMNVAPGQDSRLYEEKIESFRNFVTKLWNICRYAIRSDENFELVEKISRRDPKTLAEKWIISELEETANAVTDLIKKKNISLAQERLRRFTWDDFADWYIEINKLENNPKVLGYIVDKILKLWHPFTPFVTEKIYSLAKNPPRLARLDSARLAETHRRKAGNDELLMVKKWPKSEKKFINQKAREDFEDLKELIIKIRNTRVNYHINHSEIILAFSESAGGSELTEHLAKIKFSAQTDIVGKLIYIKTRKRSVGLDISHLIDIKKEITAIEAEIINLENLVGKTEAMLNNQKFISGAGKEVVDSYRVKLGEYREKIFVQQGLLKNLKRL
ncbi:MAG TPA: valine--tRNA ligase, partial [Patescibacteria group bacterium]